MCTDVSDLDIEILFKELWKNAKPLPFFYNKYGFEPLQYSPPEKYNTGFWYYYGRPLKICFKNLQSVNYRDYDMYNGEGKFMEVVSKIRERRD